MLKTFLQLSRIALENNFRSIVLIINSSKSWNPICKFYQIGLICMFEVTCQN